MATPASASSHPAGVEVGQPEILAEAKRASIDPDVVSQQAWENRC